MNSTYVMNHLSKSIVIILLIGSEVFGSKIWKISTQNGTNLSCTKLIGVSNDSLHTEMLGKRRSFAMQDIIRLTKYNRNVNKMMIAGAVIGGMGGLFIDTYVNGNNKIDFKNNGSLLSITGLIGGTLTGHLLSVNKSIDLSKMENTNKQNIIESLVLLETP